MIPRLLTGIVIVLALATAVAAVLTWPDDRTVRSSASGALETQRAEVTRVEREECPVPDDTGCTRAHFIISDGKSKGDEGSLVTTDRKSDVRLTVGDTIRVIETPEEQLGEVGGFTIERWSFNDYDRSTALLILTGFFVAIVLISGRLKGARALLGLGLSCAMILLYLVPGLLQGENAVLIACVAALSVMFLTIPLAHGWGLTTIAATLGTATSLAITVALAIVFTNLANLTGYNDEAAAYLSMSAENLSIQGLLLAGIVIAALGVLDDVTVSQASTVLALRHANPSLPFTQLFRRALTVGRDHITATINTLVLAYAGASLPTLLVFAVVDVSALQALNGENVASQIVGTLVGSIGLIAAMPITTALAALLAVHVPADEIDPHAGHTHAH